ncbi:hypothetical protein K4F52_003144 [Lecanicillium sp. MT-2017a]|nr:hypothetical protein K4F52_003144 [Lecanicillium sp. MT-2017a]
MSKPNTPIALPPNTPATFLRHVLAHETYSTTLVICGPKDDFINSVIADIDTPRDLPGNKDENIEQSELGDAEQPPRKQRDPLLIATLMQIATSRHIRTAFVPTVTHLRAYLSTFTMARSPVSAPPVTRPQKRPPQLLVYGFLHTHRDGSEWSAQGVGTTAACLVEAAARTGLRAAIVEPRLEMDERDAHLFEEQLPIVSGSLRKADGTWSGRTVSAKRVLGRWFTFTDKDPDECI